MASQLEWSPFKLPNDTEATDFCDGVHTLGGSGSSNIKDGLALHVFAINRNMEKRALVNADGEMLVVAQLGHLDVQTEFGMLYLQPGEIMVIPAGMRYRVSLANGSSEARGYIIEVFGSKFELPDLGPLGGYGLANPRDFLVPMAYLEVDNLDGTWEVFTKLNGTYHKCQQDHSPFDVAAWHGNCYPYKYDLTKFVPQNAAAVDHTDPSVNTVLTAKSRNPNAPLVDFLLFGPRWDVAENTYRLPYFHRNAACEFLANICGKSAGRSGSFQSGGGSYESGHIAHGSFNDAAVNEMKRGPTMPRKIMVGTLTFMMESSRTLLFTEWGLVKCGVVSHEGTDASVWDRMPVCCANVITCTDVSRIDSLKIQRSENS